MSAVPNLPRETLALHSNGGLSGVLNGALKSPFKLNDTPIENFRPIKVIVIGAGYSGIYCGIRIPEKIRNAELVIYEKNAGVGGTWWENKYLGCACDVPSHSYQYSFEPNPSWSSLYAPAAEIQAYLARVASKYSADRFIKLSHEITECRWDDASAKWNVTVKNLATGEVIHDSSDVLISARGNLNTPYWPEIDGFKDFKGEVMHSARWNESYDFANKRIALIGSGSSSIQILPGLQRLPGTHTTVFARSKTWISPSFGQQLWDKYGFEGFTIPSHIQEQFEDPEHYQKFRLSVEEDGNAIHAFTIKGTEIQNGAKELFTQNMKKRLESKPEIFEKLLPAFSPGCRRLTPGPGYLEALTQDNVAFVTTPISRISETAVHTADGQTHPVDALVCATGFHASTAPPFPITGLHGLTLEAKWEHRPENYLSHSISGFPNMFIMLGPNAAIGSGALVTMIENVGDYIVKCIRKLQKDNISRMTVRAERVADFLEYVDTYFVGTVFSESCRSWYKNKGGGGGGQDGNGAAIVTGLWPGSTLHCVEAMRSPRWEDYRYKYRGDEDDSDEEAGEEMQTRRRAEGLVDATTTTTTTTGNKQRKRANRLAWLGNGWTSNQLENRDLAWYLYPQFVDGPVAPRPEDKESLKIRPFSY
ncbi:FAD/NAD(P)-binding domain-containing protein [Melanomma pulvis-pyrius CBS 109.77]|uniref:FAD/NAD(P)-binding domain-containing protein n=1 Tax=Melanomma pulvis-pyrius CBS 109.77 TaxID=1314802 RepID=A0A6A6X045_9PLEO|nr:FAD/NAD(P)-binding domain-containing protein [Melanomma pulvis-pyrius CBS 109.77]